MSESGGAGEKKRRRRVAEASSLAISWHLHTRRWGHQRLTSL